MSPKSENSSKDRASRTLIKAFAFAGAILGIGGFGLARTIILLCRELEWLSHEPHLGRAYWWLGGGALIGLAVGWGLVLLGRNKR